jgi:hypothetical protein
VSTALDPTHEGVNAVVVTPDTAHPVPTVKAMFQVALEFGAFQVFMPGPGLLSGSQALFFFPGAKTGPCAGR